MADATALERARLTIRGVRAELVLEDGHLTLSKDGPPATSLSFAVDQVRGTVLEPGSRGGRGWIHLAVVGGTLAPPGELAAMSDPYTIPLTSRAAVTARRLARIVEKHLHERGLPPEPTFAASALERGRFSSGVALTQAPGAVRTVVDLRTDDAGPPSPRSPSQNGSSLATERPVSTVPVRSLDIAVPALPGPSTERTSNPSASNRSGSDDGGTDTSSWPRDVEDDDPRAVRTAVAEAALDARAPIEPAARPGGWVKPSGSAHREVTDPGSSPKPTAPPPVGPPAPPAAAGRELATELRQLGELHASGVLTDAEFEQAKARVLR